MVTLTLRTVAKKSRLHTIWKMRKEFFYQLRERGYKILGWCGVIEPEPEEHIHLIIDCPDYIPQYEMAELWESITGDSMIVYIATLRDKGRGAHYCTKYITKTKGWTRQYKDLDSLKSLRICQSDGLQQPEKTDISGCICGAIHTLHPTYTSEYYRDLPTIDVDEL
jgi:REP element-mobilizing transposase RayT